ncbi:alpha/beta fold hydrolase [Catenovulum sp. SM1970]|uniref:alpha/beta family hydrolase n=1 Tax=Marinifaba aquimaris TaxID=2741323 RepID=UPI001574E737|nr:alpha/beta family hydrolase [Marinifaba aquimaris]NTS75999.1 alpha/beta fold hydrolase [Marinifaba aquimaris]
MTVNNFFKADQPIAHCILAHGAGAGSDSDFMQSMARALAEQNIDVTLFDFPYMQVIKETGKKRPPGKFDKLIDAFVEQVEHVNNTTNLPILIGGKSMGGRVASHLATQALGIKMGFALGYPFHPPGKPEKLRLDHLPQLTSPFLVVQGERDTFGKKMEVESYALPDILSVVWCESGDHSLKPLKSSGITHQEHLDYAAKQIREFLDETL